MPDLGTCLNCGRLASSAATECPGCRSRFPHGSICGVCGCVTSEKEGLPWPPRPVQGLPRLYHRACVDAILPRFRPNCRICNADLRKPDEDRHAALAFYYGTGGWVPDPACPSCGEPCPFHLVGGICKKCGFALPESDAVTVIGRNTYDRPESQDFHRACAPEQQPAALVNKTGCLLCVGLIARLIAHH